MCAVVIKRDKDRQRKRERERRVFYFDLPAYTEKNVLVFLSLFYIHKKLLIFAVVIKTDTSLMINSEGNRYLYIYIYIYWYVAFCPSRAFFIHFCSIYICALPPPF